MKGTTRDQPADLGFSAPPEYLTDLTQCEPSGALDPEPRRGRWRTVEYTTDILSGVMVVAGPETAAPEISYRLRASGWHAVSLGLYGAGADVTRVKVKLSGEQTFSILTAPQSGEIQEVFWKVADLSGRALVLGQMSWRVAAGDGPGALQSIDPRVAYIKLVPLSDDDVTRVQADRKRTDTRRLFAHNDAHTVHLVDRPTTAEQIRRHIEPYRNTDVSRLYWEAGMGDLAYYLSDVARVPTSDDLMDLPRQGDRLLAESWRAFRDQGVDPFRVALDYAHEIGLEFHASYRVAGFNFPPLHDHYTHGDTFYKAHPELRGQNREGDRSPRLSYTYPEARRFVVSVLREVAGFPVDGVCLLYNRRPPLVEYEPPLVEGFMAEYGEDPRHLDEMDPRWLSYRATVLTQFMREVRRAMDEVAEQRTPRTRIDVSAVVMSSEEENLYRGMDLKAWVDERLVDTLVPYSSAPNVNSHVETWADVRDIEYFVSLTKGTSCKLAPNIMPRLMSAEDYRRRVAALYDAGVESFFFWDTDVLQPRTVEQRSWNALCRLGHREEVDAWVKAGEPGLAAPTMPLRMIGDYDDSYATPG